MAAGSTYTPIATTTLSTTQTEVNFTSISGSYTDLILIASGSTTSATSLFMRVGNGSVDTSANYSVTRLYGNGTSVSSDRLSSQDVMYVSTGNFTTANTIINLQNYSNTTTYKTMIYRLNMPGAFVGANVNLWRSTSAINTIKVYVTSSTLTVGSTFTLYGILAA